MNFTIQPPEDIGLSGYTIEYISGSTQKQLELTGTVTSHTSYLIKGQEEKTSADLICTIEKADQEWDLAISNKQYRILLKKGEEQIDGISVNEAAAEGTALADPEMIRSSPRKRRSAVSALSIRVIMQPILKYSITVRSHPKSWIR